MSDRRTLEVVMLTTEAKIMDVLIGHDERVYKMALYMVGNIKFAMFVHKDSSTNLWASTALPEEFEDPVFFNDFTLTLAEMGYILETKMTTNQ